MADLFDMNLLRCDIQREWISPYMYFEGSAGGNLL